MRSIFFRILVSSLALAMGLGFVSIARSRVGSVNSVYRKAYRYLHPLNNHFQSVSIACGEKIHMYTYRSDDGQSVVETKINFDDAAEAGVVFQRTMKRAEHIIEHVPESRNARGETGDRTVFAALPNTDGTDGGVTIIWFDGHSSLETIDAQTLELARDFEEYWFDEFVDYQELVVNR
jgi:hypothetical protein